MGGFIDITNQKFGRLTALHRLPNKKGGHVKWVFQCDCGNTAIITGKQVRRGGTTSCGCYRKEVAKKHAETILVKLEPHNKYIPSECKHLHWVWSAMLQRCKNPKEKGYHNYGGRGIYVTEEWDSFRNFMLWAKKSGYQEGLTIERVNVNGNYEPSNCTWIPRSEQSKNRRPFSEWKRNA